MPIAGTHFVRPAVSADFSAWKPLWDGYNAFYGRQPDEDITRTTWARFSDPAEPMHALVVEQDGKLVGLVHYLFHRSTSMIAPTCYLQDLFTSEALRGRGIGRALIEDVYRCAREHGAERVYWQTHETNLSAMKLYDQVAERSGFVVYRHALGIALMAGRPSLIYHSALTEEFRVTATPRGRHP